MSTVTDIEFDEMGGGTATLGDHAGKVVLVVNVASQCGLTPQYEGLQKLYEDKKDQGFMIVGFPANDFVGQEPGTDEEIAEFCSTNYSVTFPIMSKISVVGENQHPLYRSLTGVITTAEGNDDMRKGLADAGLTPNEDPDIVWNFEKFLIGRNGEVVGRFAPRTAPDDPALVEAIDAELAK